MVKEQKSASGSPQEISSPEEPPVPPPMKKRRAPLPPSTSPNEENTNRKDSVLSRNNPFHPDNISNSDFTGLSSTNPFHAEYDETNKGTQAANFDIDKLSKVLFKANGKKEDGKRSVNEIAPYIKDTTGKTEESEAKRKLKSSRFRFLNERLYTQSGAESLKMFKSDGEAAQTFKTYHEGYAEQAKKWPMDPLDLIISSIMKKKLETLVIADFGCGEARLARALSSSCKKIYSFDLVALNEEVTVCDFSRTPLNNESVDIAVFCLSLMGTNIRDYLREANRVLKLGGVLKIAEVESRFDGEMGIDNFVEFAEKCGFNLRWKDLQKKYFYLMDFRKTSKCHKKKIPDMSLKPCLYKKR